MSRKLNRVLLVALLVIGLAAATAYSVTYRVAFTSVPSITDLPMEIVFAHLAEQGYDFEPVYFDSDNLATAALASGQVEIGMLIPFAAIQQGADLRIFIEGRGIEFVPVVPIDIETWQDMDGREMYVHSRASSTEALARFVEVYEGIEFSSVKYLPGSEVRSVALMAGNIPATFLDLTNTKKVMDEAPGQFHVLPLQTADASTESFTASQTFIAENPDVIKALITELIKVFRRGTADVTYWVEEADKYGLLLDLPDRDQMGEMLKASIEFGVYDPNGAIDHQIAVNNLELMIFGEVLVGPLSDLKVEDYYDFGPLNEVLDELGIVNIDTTY